MISCIIINVIFILNFPMSIAMSLISIARSSSVNRLLPFLICFILLSILVIPFNARAQHLHFERLADKDGLYKRTITCGLQDKTGFMWFGSEDGLLRYDGYNFEEFVYDPDDENSLSSNLVYALLEDHDGILWIGTVGGGLNKYDQKSGKFTRFTHDPGDPDSLSHNGVVSLLEDSKGRLWIGTEGGGLNRLDPGNEKFHHYRNDPTDPETISFDSMWHLYEDAQGKIWIGTHGGGLNVLDPEQGTFRHFRHDSSDPKSIASDTVGPIFIDSHDNFWVGGINGLNLFDPATGTFTRYQHDPQNPTGLVHNHVWDILEDDNGTIWLGSFGGGLSRFNPEDMLFSSSQYQDNELSSLSSDLVWCLLKSQDGVLWIGTDGGGLNKFISTTLQFNHHTAGSKESGALMYNGVNGIAESESGLLWMANDGGGLQSFDPVSKRSQLYVNDPANSNSLSSDLTEAILVDHKGIVWVGTYNGGLNAYNPLTGLFTHYRNDPKDPNSLSDNRVWALFEDSENNIWVGTRNGLNRLDLSRKIIRRFVHDPSISNSISDNGIWAVFEDSGRRLWVGTDNGLNLLEKGNSFIRFYNQPEDSASLSHNNITVLFESKDGSLWVGTNGGLNKMDTDSQQFVRFTEKNGLASNSIRGIMEDGKDDLWITTVKGLTHFSPANNSFHTYRFKDGLQGSEFSRAHLNARNGEMVIGGRNGINIFNPLTIINNQHIPPVVLTEFSKINSDGYVGGTVDSSDAIPLSYRDTTITFEFAALDFTHSEANCYRYKLEGFDSDWIEAENRHRATYTNLGGGNYTFRVRASNNHGVWNLEGLIVPISITYPPWQRWWAYLLYAIFLLLCFWGSIELRARQHRQKLAYVEQVNKDLETEVLERKKTERALILSEQRLSMALEAAHEGIWEFNPQTGDAYFSPTWFTMLGYAADEFSHTYENWKKHIHPEDRPVVIARLQSYLDQEDEQYSVEFRMKTKGDSLLWIHSTGKILEYNEDGSPVKMIGIHLDISNRKASEAETRRLETALQQASKMEAIGTLAGGIAHDFNNILSAIIGNSELGLQGVEKESRLHSRFQQILQASFRARDLVLQILTFSRKEKRVLQPVKVDLLIKEALNLLRSTIPTTIAIKQLVNADIKPVLADPTQIHQILINLCTNASHAMEDKGGILLISLSEVVLTSNELQRHPELTPGVYNEIKILDTGEGIEPTNIESIFNPYFSTKKQGKGSGLGLSVVFGIVENCGGIIEVESSPGIGSAFTVLLPCITGEVQSEQHAVALAFPPLEKECTILVIDDEPVLIDILSQHLTQMGHKAITFHDAQKALNAFQKEPDIYDLIITDMAMPELTGLEVAQQIKELRKDIPVILCTGYSSKAFVSEPKELGVDSILIKPIGQLELMNEMYALLSTKH
ncbi:MAG: PAS domain S-box-containing protein [Desulforhopalus sp.]|jgi:PAS domain S-box-containing protein